MSDYMIPCVEYCRSKFGRSYSKKCDKICDYARVVREKEELEKKCSRLEEKIKALSDFDDRK